jgi:hypothetical protein
VPGGDLRRDAQPDEERVEEGLSRSECSDQVRILNPHHPAAIADLRRKVVEEVTTVGARNIIKFAIENKYDDMSLPVAGDTVVKVQETQELEYGVEDVRAEAYGTPIRKLRKKDLEPIRDVNELPEICRMIHIMRFLQRTRSAISNSLSRLTRRDLENGGHEVPLGESDIPRPIDAKTRHKTWSKSEVIRWKQEREQWKQSPKRKGRRS